MIVLDSSLLIAAISAGDSNHKRAKAVMEDVDRGVWGRVLVPDYVLVEVANALLKHAGFGQAASFVASTTRSRTSFVVPCFESLRRALELFHGQRDGRLSLADAAIVAVAERERVRNIATFDSGFRVFPGLNIVSGPKRAA